MEFAIAEEVTGNNNLKYLDIAAGSSRRCLIWYYFSDQYELVNTIL
jgi:hypothetical protein